MRPCAQTEHALGTKIWYLRVCGCNVEMCGVADGFLYAQKMFMSRDLGGR